MTDAGPWQRRPDLSSSLYHDALAAGRVGIDIETTELDVRSAGLVMVQICSPSGLIELIDANGSLPRLKLLLRSQNVRKVSSMGAYDLGLVQRWLEPSVGNFRCLRVLARLTLGESADVGLRSLSRQLLGVELDKRLAASDWSSSLDDEQLQHAANDVRHLLAIETALDQRILKTPNAAVEHRLQEKLPMVARQYVAGIAIPTIFRY